MARSGAVAEKKRSSHPATAAAAVLAVVFALALVAAGLFRKASRGGSGGGSGTAFIVAGVLELVLQHRVVKISQERDRSQSFVYHIIYCTWYHA